MNQMPQKKAVPAVEARRRFVPLAQQEGVILDAAAKLFLDRGYEGVSIDAITAVVGGSKRNVYDLFGNKETLFRAVIAHLAKARVSLVREISAEGDLHAVLTAIGVSILNILLAPETLSLHRLMVAEAGRVPESAAVFLENGPDAACRAVEDLLLAHSATSGRSIPNPEIAARMFVDALAGGLLLRALLGKIVTAEDIQQKSQHVVRTLFKDV